MDQQAQLLRRFLALFASKEAVEGDGESGFSAEFLKLKRQSTKYRTEKTYPTKAAEKQENVKKNRYKDIVPFDHTRVKLSLSTSKNDTDYINANFIKGVLGPRAYIATQGPLPNTVVDFWRMLWEYNVQIIVMACREFEMGKKKCERYWPESKVDAFVCEPFTIRCEYEENKGDYLTRILRVTFNKSSRTLKQLHYMNWPDHGVPDSIPPILELLQEMRVHQEHEDVPICIHCSAGCGRTGALCAIDYTWNLLKRQIIPENFSIYDLVQDMRTQRPSVVQTKEQYELVYRTIKFLFESYLQMIEPTSNQKEVPSAPSPIPEDSDSDSEFADLIDLVSEPTASAMENSLQLFSEHRYSRKEIPMEVSNHIAPNVFAQQLPVSPPLSPLVLAPKDSSTDAFSAMTDWTTSITAPKLAATETALWQTDFGHYLAQMPDPLMRPRSDALSMIKPLRTQEPSPKPLDQAVINSTISAVAPHQPPPIQKPIRNQKPLEQAVTNNAVSAVAPPQPPPVQKPIRSQSSLEQIMMNNAVPTVASHQPTPAQMPIPSQRPLEQAVMNNAALAVLPHHTPPVLQLNPSHRPPDQTGMNSAAPSLGHPQPPQINAACLTVEDPYFGPDSPKSSDSFYASAENILAVDKWTQNPCFSGPILTLNDQPLELPTQGENAGLPMPSSDERKSSTSSSEESPPPLPERTPESYIMADEDKTLVTQSLMVVIPSTTSSVETVNGATEKPLVSQSLTVVIPSSSSSEMVNGESPPSPAPPLPERTPESYEMATDEDLVQNAVQENPQQTVHRVGKSLEWSGISNTDSDIKRTWSRSKSLRARLTMSLHIPSQIQPLALPHTPPEAVTQEPPRCPSPPLNERTPQSFQLDAPESSAPLTPPLPKRTPESFILDTQEEQSNSALCEFPDTQPQRQRLGTSSEWAGNSQPRTFLDVMSRSKSVKVKSSKQEPLSVAPPPPSPASIPIVTAQRGEQQLVDSRLTVPTGAAVQQPDTAPGRTSLASKARTKSLRFLKGRQKTKTPQPLAPAAAAASAATPAAPPSGATGVFKFGFGMRFGKPKGPRTHPETWV
ncbi:tyrosine-protein phosphatase non-receptor type 22 isoform X2 [Salminus brasiliensis]|uniref:tyrosine-protein phosphatase non-receptor type 22 isoform X2 n=1 Tax=Salminus brasiliensis TaxID=930266 RepID=UPI003B82DC9C